MTIVAATPFWGKLASNPPEDGAMTCALGSNGLRAKFYSALRPVTGEEWAGWLRAASQRGERLKQVWPLVNEYCRVIDGVSETMKQLRAVGDATSAEDAHAIRVLEKEKQEAETLLRAAMRVLE